MNIKQLTYVGYQPEIPLNSALFHMNQKYCYKVYTKFSKTYLISAVFKKYVKGFNHQLFIPYYLTFVSFTGEPAHFCRIP